MLAWKIVFGQRLQVREELKVRVKSLDEREQIKDLLLLKKSLVVLGFIV